MVTQTPRVGLFPPMDLLARGADETAAFLASVDAAGIDHVACGDHVSFAGHGFDGLLQATALLMLHPSLPVSTGIYLLPLRHPVPVARQLSDIARMAPGRLVFGVGIGGESRSEVVMCGVDPATRGRRMDECLTILRGLATGAPMSYRGQFFELDDAIITPAPAAAIPVVVGGRSNVAVERAGLLGDGWLGIWNSARRFVEAVDLANRTAEASGRTDYPARHAMQVWCGFGDTKEAARAALAPQMEAFYQLPFERFEKYCPYGTVDDVAEFLAEYVAAGCREFNLLSQAADSARMVADTAQVRRILATV